MFGLVGKVGSLAPCFIRRVPVHQKVQEALFNARFMGGPLGQNTWMYFVNPVVLPQSGLL